MTDQKSSLEFQNQDQNNDFLVKEVEEEVRDLFGEFKGAVKKREELRKGKQKDQRMEQEEQESVCGKCRKEVRDNSKAIQCDMCRMWFHAHKMCGGSVMEKMYEVHISIAEKALKWFCEECEQKWIYYQERE